MISKRVFRSTSVSNTGSSLSLAPSNVSISQWPKCSRDSTSSGLSLMEGPSTRRFSRFMGEPFLGFRETFSSKSMFFVFIIPRLIQLYRGDVQGIRSLEKRFSFAAPPTTISGDHSFFNILSSAQFVNESHTNHFGRRPQY